MTRKTKAFVRLFCFSSFNDVQTQNLLHLHTVYCQTKLFGYFTCEVPVFLFGLSSSHCFEVGGLRCKKMMLHNFEPEM